MRRLELIYTFAMGLAVCAFGVIYDRGAVPFGAINFILLLAAPAAYFYSDNFTYGVMAFSWIALFPASVYLLRADPVNAALPVALFNGMMIVCGAYKKIIRRERVLWNRRLNERIVTAEKLRADYDGAGIVEEGIKSRELAIINLYEITKKMSEDLKFDDIFNAVSIFLKENFTFRKCDLLIFRGAGDDMAVDREYTLWYGRESGASAGRIDYDKLATMFMAGFRDVYLTRSENQQTFADLRVEDPAVESLLAVPLLSEKRMVGMFVAQNLPKADVERFVILSTQFALELKKVLLYEMVERMAITDSLTGLYVRRHFSERLEEELQRSARFGFRLAFLMLDIDDFKKTNDTYGHLVGDAVLKDMARLIKESVREIDIVARYGGEEISLMLPETSRASAMTVAERLRRKIEGYEFKAYDERVRVTVSIGVSVYPDDAQDQRELVDKADEALYTAKNSGKNVVCEWRKRYNIENHKL